jgi:hypothetical protein
MVKYSLLFKFRFMLLTIGNNLDKRCFTYVAWYFSVVVWFWFFHQKLINVSKISFQIPFSSIFSFMLHFIVLKRDIMFYWTNIMESETLPVPIVLTIVNFSYQLSQFYLHLNLQWKHTTVRMHNNVNIRVWYSVPLKNWTLTMNRNFFISF